MNRRPMKYNPAFLSGDELVETFVVRQAELGLIVQVLRENKDDANQHLLVIGPRGIGKTTLVLRAMEEVRRQTDLSQAWYPLVFSEESYIVTNAGEFWLEAIFHLGQQTDEGGGKRHTKNCSERKIRPACANGPWRNSWTLPIQRARECCWSSRISTCCWVSR